MSEVKHAIALIKRAPKADILILLVTFSLTIFVDLVMAVNIGVILAVGHFLYRMAASVEVNPQPLTDQQTKQDQEVLTYTIEGPIFFGAVKQFEYAFNAAHFNPKVLIIRFGWVPLVDFTGLQALEDSIKNMQKKGIRVILCSANNQAIENKLQKAGIFTLLGEDNVFADWELAMGSAV